MRARDSLILGAAMAIVLMTACEKKPGYEDGYRQGVVTGYRQGANDAFSKMESAADQFRAKLRRRAENSLLLFSVITALLTLYGDALAEHMRRRLSAMFRIPPGMQMAAAGFLYSAVALGLVFCGLRNFGLTATLPIIILAAASSVPFYRYLGAVRREDRILAKASIVKVKSLLFLASAVLVVFALLGKAGFMNIRVC